MRFIKKHRAKDVEGVTVRHALATDEQEFALLHLSRPYRLGKQIDLKNHSIIYVWRFGHAYTEDTF
jgi:hypothetical protein